MSTNIEWTDETWNPIVGCSVVSPGCTNCYAMKQAARIEMMHEGRHAPHAKPGDPEFPTTPYAGLTQPSKAGAVWTGKVALASDETLTKPLRWKRGRRIFVNSMGDLFHESVPDAWIDRVFAVMALAPQHVFQVLTKRSKRMMIYCSDPNVTHRVAQAIDGILVDQDHERDPVERWAKVPGFEAYETSTHGNVRRDRAIIKPINNPLYDRPSVTLWRENEPTTVYVHIIVLRAHRGDPPDGCESRHRNGNRQDNRLANLEWASGSINQKDKVRHGSNGGPAKITREQAADIRAKRRTERTQQSVADEYGVSRSLVSMIESRRVWPDALAWPLSNVWKGVSAEDQARADERIPDLLATPAAVRFVSAEPLLSALDLSGWLYDRRRKGIFGASGAGLVHREAGREDVRHHTERRFGDSDRDKLASLNWVICGGESGPGARPMHPDWARSIRDQCAAAGVAFFFKQWGEWHPCEMHNGVAYQFDGVAPFDSWNTPVFDPHQESGINFRRLGKARAGRLLDGVEHNGYPRTA